MIGNSDNKINFSQEVLLTNRQVVSHRKSFANNLSTDIKISKTQLFKMIQLEEFLGKVIGPLLKTGLPLMNNIIKPLAKSVLIPLKLTATASATDARIHKTILGSGITTLIISNDMMK